jgi:hypothetical protein
MTVKRRQGRGHKDSSQNEPIRSQEPAAGGANKGRSRRVYAGLRCSNLLTHSKCDESRPQCTYCKTHNVPCIYSSYIVTSPKLSSSDELSVITSRSQSSPYTVGKASRLSSSPESSISLFLNWNANDLRLLHHYSTLTSGSLFLINRCGADRILQFEVPRLAFEHDFMMHCVLGIASLHLNYLAPDVPEYQSLTIAHRVNALSGFRVAISQLSKETYRAVLAGSLLLLILSSDLSVGETGGDLWIGNWLGLWAGMREMIKVVSWAFVQQSGLAPIFSRDNHPRTTLANLPSALSDMLLPMDPDNEDTRIILSTLGCLSRLYEYLLLKGFTQELTTRVIAWPANTNVAEFAALAKRRQPQALVIAAYYLVFTKLVDKIWWMADISGREIEAIANALPIEYQSLMIIPLQAVHLHSKLDTASLLLSQLPGRPSYEDDLERVSKPICGELQPAKEVG